LASRPRRRRCIRIFQRSAPGANGWKAWQQWSASAPPSHRAARSNMRGDGWHRTARNT